MRSTMRLYQYIVKNLMTIQSQVQLETFSEYCKETDII